MSAEATPPPITGAPVSVIGAGPAGLMAAERLAGRGCAVTVHDRMPSPARKFLLAGRGGLNLTHSEPLERLLELEGPARPALEPAIRAFSSEHLVDWCHGLGIETFVGSSGRVFPRALKASPLLRAWLRRLEAQGVRFALRRRWTGWTPDGDLAFEGPAGLETVRPAAT
ncbi:NAD(P)/FAD-dependent oxidoreductase, partial [Methylopila musalis]